jgi:putative inorganic carbon (hco3(-)) transporter
MDNELYHRRFSFRQYLYDQFIEKKLNTVFGYIFLLLLASGIAYCNSEIDIKVSVLVVGLAGALAVLIAIMRWPYFGFYFLISFASVIVLIDRLINSAVPTGLLVETLTYFCLLSILLTYDLKKNINMRFYINPITIGIYILFAYYIIELFNPEMYNPVGWLSYFKRQFSYFVFYYMCYCLLDSKARIIFFVRFMIALTTILALYACKQQWFGYADFELRRIGTGIGYSLLFQGGMLRKFSVFSDPATSGVLFASMVVLCVVLAFRSTNNKEKMWLGVATVANLLGYSYSGTRTATLMIVAGILMYFISAIFEPRTIKFMIYPLVVFLAILVMPFHNPVTNRIRSTFDGTKDASAALRDYDRHEVQPYIQAHPMGGGIFTVGIEGEKYNEGHYLEFLQPDSGYMKVLAEQGPIGLALLLCYYFVIMRVGYRNFYRVVDPEIRTYYIGLLIMMFTLLVAQYAQLAIAQYPVVLYFSATTIIFIKLADFDTAVQPETSTQI